MEFIDTHAHVYLNEFEEDLEDILGKARDHHISRILTPNIDRYTLKPMLDLEQRSGGYTIPMLGLHPCSVKQDYKDQLKALGEMLPKRTWVAIGEVGLDLYWDKSTFNLQLEALEIQTEWSKSYQLPLVLHCREAFDELFEFLESKASEGLFGVFHCFTGTLEQAKRVIDIGFFLGIGGVYTYKNGGLKPIIQELGLERVILETDSPYLAPVPHRGKRNEPAYLLDIAQEIEHSSHYTLDQVGKITTENARKLFNLQG